jgi:tyrosyl-tRNA synthetase
MNKEIKITAKMELAMKVVKEMGGKAYAREVLEYLDANYADRADLTSFNAVNATLAAIAGKDLMKKSKGMFREKLLTQYELVEADAE